MSTSAATAPAARLHAASTGKAHAASARWGALRHGAPRRGGRCFAFGSNSKEEAAKKALRDALMGKKDILAEVEKNNLMRESGGGGGGGPGGRKGGGGGGGGFGDWNRLRRETGETLKAVGIIVGVVRPRRCVVTSLPVADRAALLLCMAAGPLLHLAPAAGGARQPRVLGPQARCDKATSPRWCVVHSG